MTSASHELAGFEPVIGLEVHAQLSTQTKLFCGCANRFGAKPNSLTCPVCIGMPGALPVLNERAVDLAVHIILALGGEVALDSVFARKNYFYPDLPKGYQITQYRRPLGTAGRLEFRPSSGESRSVRIRRVHLEEDAGKLLHPESGAGTARLDLNRCGVPLVEIVTEPDISSPDEAYHYLVALKQILQYTETCQANMEKGQLRCDANVSVRLAGSSHMGTRTELKNLNSFKAVRRGLAFEIDRQAHQLSGGGSVEQATLLWDETRRQAVPIRSKEKADDYRYFPEPDLPPLILAAERITKIREGLPELPAQKRQRLVDQYGIRAYDASLLTSSKDLADYFEIVADLSGNPRSAANWICTELLGAMNREESERISVPVSAASLADLISRIDNGELTGTMAKRVFTEMQTGGNSPERIIERLGLRMITDRSVLEKLVEDVLAEHETAVASYRGGKAGVLGFFVGEIMRKTKGQADVKLVTELLRRELGP